MNKRMHLKTQSNSNYGVWSVLEQNNESHLEKLDYWIEHNSISYLQTFAYYYIPSIP